MSSRIPRAWTSRRRFPKVEPRHASGPMSGLVSGLGTALRSRPAFEVRFDRGFDLWLAALVAVTAAVWALGLVGDRYDAGPPLAFADGFPGAVDGWVRNIEDPGLVVDANGVELLGTVPGERYAKRAIPLPAPAERPSGGLLRVRARTETLAAPADDVPWQRPLVMIWVVDDAADDGPIDFRTVADVPGRLGTHFGERVIQIPPEADSLWLTFQGRDSGGSYRLSGASLELVAPNPGRLTLLAGVAAVAALLGLAALVRLVRRGGRWVAIALVVVFAGTLVGILVPESISTGLLRHRLGDVAFSLPKIGRVEFRDLYKVGHFGFFLAGALVAFAARGRLGLSRTRLGLLFATLAVATEGVQLHLFDRTTRGSDVLVDLAGVALAALLVETALRLPYRRARPGASGRRRGTHAAAHGSGHGSGRGAGHSRTHGSAPAGIAGTDGDDEGPGTSPDIDPADGDGPGIASHRSPAPVP